MELFHLNIDSFNLKITPLVQALKVGPPKLLNGDDAIRMTNCGRFCLKKAKQI